MVLLPPLLGPHAGYSDSGKDAGRLAAAWALFEAQEKLVRSCPHPFTLPHPSPAPPPLRRAQSGRPGRTRAELRMARATAAC